MTSKQPPRCWDFKAHAGPDTMFTLSIFGEPSVKSLTNIIQYLEMTRSFLDEDEAEGMSRRADLHQHDGE